MEQRGREGRRVGGEETRRRGGEKKRRRGGKGQRRIERRRTGNKD